MITPQNILFHELIGLDVAVVHASSPSLVGITGLIIDETKNTVMIKTVSGLKMVGKKGITLRTRIPGGKVVDLDGSALLMAPERRTTMRIRK
ncbi:MAG TPA: ribonuclease P protein component 1 [Methanospirillum sp.]|uniref:ribonuclease P protein component 1 n=1 Tax=Methanospirillum sp. TaxID=45200 RepID=UPI002BC8F2A5|nr:ribonuclease P protein component 1 [Methanospirillum sp.]HWQ65203.1 ribonuclease P protein component 1 [Methanospirillum sp.]